jgi:hypothetical protein
VNLTFKFSVLNFVVYVHLTFLGPIVLISYSLLESRNCIQTYHLPVCPVTGCVDHKAIVLYSLNIQQTINIKSVDEVA